MKKRLLSTLLCLCMVFALLPAAALAATSHTPYQEARSLYARGLFNGYDNTGSNFGLEDPLTREQALILLIRLLGEESAAKAWTGAAPFTDVPEDSFARPYIGYAKEKGYTSGIGGGAFGLGQRADQKNMVVFALRGLGYSDGGEAPDFTYAGCLDKAVELEILESNQEVADFNRGDAVQILFNAMSTPLADHTNTLSGKLEAAGIVTREQTQKALEILLDPAEREAPAKPVEQTKPASTATTEDPLPPEDYTKSPAWYMSVKAPKEKTNANLVGDLEALWQWREKMNGEYTEPVMIRDNDLSEELYARVRALNSYVQYLARVEDMRNRGDDRLEQAYTNSAQEMKDSDAYKRATASDLTPLKPHLSDEAIAFYGLQ